MGIKRLTGDLAQTTVGANPGVDADTSVTITADTTAGSKVLGNVSSVSGLVPGQEISGAGIPPYITIASINSGVVLLSDEATATAAGVTLTVVGATQVLGLTDWTMTFKVKTVDATTTDDDAWEDSLPSSSSWTAKAKYVYLMGDPSQMTHIIQAIIGSGRRASSQWNFFLDSESGDDSFTGQAFISGLGISSVIGRTVTMDVSLQGRGPLNLRNLGTLRASLRLPTGSLAFVVSRSLGRNEYSVVWGDFVMISTLPPDADIQGIYPVIIASGVFDAVTSQALAYGTGLTITTLGGSPFTSPSNPNNTTFPSTEFYGPSIGTSLSLLAAQKIQALLLCSLNIPAIGATTPLMTDTIEVGGVGYAIYYNSATPGTDAIMPPPFAVPPGQGVAWAMPFTVTKTGGPFSGGFGIFSDSSGQGLGISAFGEV
jgi:hypothetical protein